MPEGYIYPKEERGLRDLLRRRSQLVRHRVVHLLSIHNQYVRQTGEAIKAKQACKIIMENAMPDFFDEDQTLAIQSNLEVLHCLEKQITLIEKRLKGRVKLRKEFLKLNTVPGIGLTLGLTIMLETGDIGRFEKAGNFASYCRCVGSKKMSNEKRKGNVKNGNKYLAWAFVEAANFAVRYSDTVKRFYQRKKEKTNNVIAIKTVAHKLARACYHIMKDQVEFDVNKAFG